MGTLVVELSRKGYKINIIYSSLQRRHHDPFPDFSFIRHLELSLLKSLLVYSFEFSFFLFQVSSDIKKHPNDAELRDKLKYVCIGDINRMATQYKRGGGTVCFRNEFVWQAYRNLIGSFEACPRLDLP